MLFDWIRKMAKNAMIAGVNEAVAELTGARSAAEIDVPEVRLLLTGPETEDAAPKSAPKRRAQ